MRVTLFFLPLLFCALSACSTLNRHENWDGRVEKLPRPPVCVAGATQPEGWLFEDGTRLRERCTDKVAYCDRVGTTLEGWYSADITTIQLINRENCSKVQNHKPECISVDSYAEGWTTSAWLDRRVLWDSCRHKVVVCARIGSEEEGWYALMPKVETAKPLKRLKCGDLLIRSSYYR